MVLCGKFRYITAAAVHGCDITAFTSVQHRFVQIPLNVPIGIKIVVYIPARLLARHFDIRRKREVRYAIHDPEIDRLGARTHLRRYHFHRNAEYLGRRFRVYILIGPKRLAHMLVPRDVREHAKFDLRIVGVYKHAAVFGSEHFAKLPAHGLPHGDILQIRL